MLPGADTVVRAKHPYDKVDLKADSTSSLFPGIFLVLQADELHQFRVRQQRHSHRRPPWLGICLGIVDGDADVHVPEILASEPRGYVQFLRRRLAQLIEPHPSVESSAIDNERVAIPLGG